jgi:hypothetical protein
MHLLPAMVLISLASTSVASETTEDFSLSIGTQVASSTPTSRTELPPIYLTRTEMATWISTPTSTEAVNPPLPSSNTIGTIVMTATSSPPAQLTGGAGRRVDTGFTWMGLGGLGAMLMLF